MSEPQVKVSVIIPSYNQKHVIFAVLESVLQQETHFPFEVIVVESSGDDTAQLVRERFPDVRVLELKERAFPGTARNEAIRMARGEILAFTDTDCVVAPDWLSTLTRAHGDGYPIVGGMVRNGTPKSIFGTVDYLLEFADLITPHPTTDKSHFGTCNVSFKKEIFERHGLFADQVKGSDSLYTRLAKAKGEVLYHQPGAVIWHKNRTDFKKILRNQYELGYGAAINRHKYNLKGKIFIKMPLLIPLMPFIRTFAIGWRLLRNSPVDFLKFILLLPFIFTGLAVHAWGFVNGRKKVLVDAKKI
jgi:glycosyltransferase involved in cell wall biosynthesis